MRIALAAALLMSAAALPAAAQTPAPAAAATANTPAAQLRQLFNDSDEGALRRNPIQGLFRGDLRYADQFGDYLTDAYFAGERAAAEDELRRLAAIDRARLSPADQISYDVFKYSSEMGLEGMSPAIMAATVVRPIDHFFGFHTFFPDLSSGQGAAPFKTRADYENNLKRIDGFVIAIDRSIGRFKEGAASGVTQPRLVVDNVIGQLDGLIAQGVDKSPFMGPTAKFPDGITAADQARFKAEYAAAVKDRIVPAFTRLRDYLKNDYRPIARTSVGLGDMKGGPALYAFLVRQQTTTTLSPDTIHQLGLSEVARIRAAMEGIKAKTGFTGTLAQFFEYIRTDPKFKPASAEALQQSYVAIQKRVELQLPRLFSLVPKTPLEIKPVPDYIAKNQAGAYYQSGTPDGARPGMFYFNTYDLPSRTTPGRETLFLHEGAPGHHFQISLAQEATNLPPFQRFGGNTAYAEGWALYAESLGEELGMFADPYEKFGNLDDEMLRAMRLVVDTGIHSKGWTRDRAIQFMLDNSSMSRTDATSEVERYIAIPGQALAYKIGQRKIRELRTRAEAALGTRFDIKAFHARVLEDGALPLGVLETKIDRWIASQLG